MIDLIRTITALGRKRPIFHSEADFQHALAWELHSRLPESDVRLELPLDVTGKVLHTDIFLRSSAESVAIELKYRTRSMSVNVNGEEYRLKDHSAQDIGRYDFLKDVRRIERIVASRPNTSGFAILLTNDSAYWKIPGDQSTVDPAFRIHEGRSLAGQLAWDPKAGIGTIRSREEPISLSNMYETKWLDYAKVTATAYGTFRFLVCSVANVAAA